MTLILGRKKGMTQHFAEDGTATGVTVLAVGPCVVCQVRTKERDGYDAVQLGFEDARDKVIPKPQRGHFRRSGSSESGISLPRVQMSVWRSSSHWKSHSRAGHCGDRGEH